MRHVFDFIFGVFAMRWAKTERFGGLTRFGVGEVLGDFRRFGCAPNARLLRPSGAPRGALRSFSRVKRRSLRMTSGVVSFAPTGLVYLVRLPTACAVGCILPPLRGSCRRSAFVAGTVRGGRCVRGAGRHTRRRWLRECLFEPVVDLGNKGSFDYVEPFAKRTVRLGSG